ncbi:hypothetical protein ACG7TL_009310 [Trametes sanguinea]
MPIPTQPWASIAMDFVGPFPVSRGYDYLWVTPTWLSNRDSKFTSKFWQETDGLSERTIHSVTQILRSMVAPDQTDWYDKIPIAEFAINSATGASTGFAPFELNYGYLPKSLNGVKTDTQFPGVKEFAQRARAYLEQAHDALIEARQSLPIHEESRDA